MKSKQRGQALLIVVLVMVVVLTVGLSVASRSIVNLRLTTEEQQSQRAFSAAEAGIDIALKGATPFPNQTLGNNAIIKEVRVNSISGNSFLLNGGNPVIKDEGIDIWIADYPDYSNPKSMSFFTLYWGFSSDNCSTSLPAALEVIVISGSKASPTSERYAFDPCSRGNNFTTADTTGAPYPLSDKTFPYRTKVTGSKQDGRININSGLIVRVIPLYANAVIGLSKCTPSDKDNCPGQDLPSQGKQIESTGVSGETTRKVTLFQGYPSLPAEFFNHILFCAKGSGSNPNSCTMQ